MLVVDGREASKHKDIIDRLEQNGVLTEKDTLSVGDFIVFGKEDTWCFERKTQQDLRSSLLSERGWEQVKALADARDMGFKVAIILESGYIWDKNAGKPLRWETFLKRHPHLETNWYSLSFAFAKWQIPIVQTKDAEGTAIFLKYIDESLGKSKEKKEYPMRQGFRKNMTLEEKRLYLFEAFGKEVAKTIVKNRAWIFGGAGGAGVREGHIEYLANLLLESGRRVGDKKGREIYEVLIE